jgi:hypothetical protein
MKLKTVNVPCKISTKDIKFDGVFNVGDKVKRSVAITNAFGAEFTGGKVIEEIVKIEPDYSTGVTKYWLSNGLWINKEMMRHSDE